MTNLPVQKLRISVSNTEIENEIRGTLNYLQRQCHDHLTLSVLKNSSVLLSYRELICTMLLLEGGNGINISYHEDEGKVIKMMASDETLVCSTWKMKFNCILHQVSDCVDFLVSLKGRLLYIYQLKCVIRININYAAFTASRNL